MIWRALRAEVATEALARSATGPSFATRTGTVAGHRSEWSFARKAHLIGALWGVVCAAVLLSGGPIWDHSGGTKEMHGVYVPKYEYLARAESQMRIPLWNPFDLCGVPFLALGYPSALYPPVFAAFASLPPREALQALYAGHIVLFAWAAVVYLSRAGFSPWLAGLAPLMGLAGLFRGYAYLGIDHPPMIMSLAWIPVQFLCWQNAARSGDRRWVGALALAGGTQLYAGYPAYLIDTGLMLSVLALAGGDAPNVSLRRRLGVLVAGLGLAWVLGAAQMLPLREMLVESARATSFADVWLFRRYFHIGSLSDLRITPVQPTFAAGLALGATALLRPDRRRLAWLVLFLWSVFPNNLPFSLQYTLPPTRLIRHLCGWNQSGGLFLGFLAVAGAWTAFKSGRPWIRWTAMIVVGAAAVQAAILVHRTPTLLKDPAPDRELLARRAELLHAMWPDPQLAPRALAYPDMLWGSTLLHGIPSAAGFEPALPPGRIDRVLGALGLGQVRITQAGSRWRRLEKTRELARFLGVGLVVTPRQRGAYLQAAGLRKIGELPPDDVVLYQPALPRARLVHRGAIVRDEDASFERLVARPQDAATTAILERQFLPVEMREPPPGARERVAITSDEPERLVVDVDAATPGILAVTDTYFPGWEVSVDGSAQDLLRVDYAFRGVAVGSGRHRVVFEYAPESFTQGVLLSTLALLVIVVLIVFPARPRPSAHGTSS